MSDSAPRKPSAGYLSLPPVDLLVAASGFEDRSFAFLERGTFHSEAHCVVIRYRNDIPLNQEAFDRFRKTALAKFSADRLHVVELATNSANEFPQALSAVLDLIPRSLHRVAFDISGCTSYGICLVLKALRDRQPFAEQTLIYTSAQEYLPSREEYSRLVSSQGEDIRYLPRSMALEMDRNLILEGFAGHRSRDGRCCLAIFAGYEAHRTSAVTEARNPALLLLLYGNPGEGAHEWRLEMSQRLHRSLESGRRSASEVVSTLDPYGGLEVLERYYRYLTDDYDLVVAPICSKMNSVASYLFWERYGEVQLAFPLPIAYDPDRRPVGVGTTYCMQLSARRAIPGD